jgi:hypothetical protein
MSRLNYSEEEDWPGQFELFQANCDRALHGPKGQRALRELEAALLALPEKRLVSGELVQPDGEVCAVGALMLHRAAIRGLSREAAIEWYSKIDPYATDETATEYFGLPRLVAWKFVEQNDIMCDQRFDKETQRMIDITPEERYERVLSWVRAQLSS